MTSTYVKPAAVIDIGTTAVRMTIAEIGDEGSFRILDSLEQSLNLGKSTFIHGSIPHKAIEECVSIIQRFIKAAAEYGLTNIHRLRAVATTAVREASNQDAFLDRVFIATGLKVDVIDEAEMTRLLYNSLAASLAQQPHLAEGPILVLDVGAGLTDALLLQSLRVTKIYAYRLGSLRLRSMLERYDAPVDHERDLMENQIRLMIEQLQQTIPQDPETKLMVLGGDIEFAASLLIPDWKPGDVGRLEVAKVEALANQLLGQPVDEIVRTYNLSIPDAETVGPALLVQARVAQSYGADFVKINGATMMEGVLRELAMEGKWSPAFIEQIEASAVEVGHKYGFSEAHGTHVAQLCGVLFDCMQDLHGLKQRENVLLKIAAIVHEVGLFISNRGHHKHSYYLIDNCDMFGLSREQLRIVALVARYHRRACPKITHLGYGELRRRDRMTVAKLSAILRVADSLDRSHAQRIKDISCRVEAGRLVIDVPRAPDFSLEQLALKQKADLLRNIFGLTVTLRNAT